MNSVEFTPTKLLQLMYVHKLQYLPRSLSSASLVYTFSSERDHNMYSCVLSLELSSVGVIRAF